MPNPRRSAALKVISGTDRPDRQAPKPVENLHSAAPKPPKNLSKAAKSEWNRLAPIAHRLGYLADSDLRSFALLCETLATEGIARAEVVAAGMTVSTGTGGLKPHPAIRTMETARAQAARLLEAHGLNPKGRSSVDPAPPDRAANRFGSNGRR
jgi:P27 family predicted phage terminase small subunit